jgi:hypothetical protein
MIAQRVVQFKIYIDLHRNLLLTCTTIQDDTVNRRPETAAFDAVLGRSLTVICLSVTYTKAYTQPRLLLPMLRVGRT